MFHHTHPYSPFIPENATKLIVGTLPPPRFTSRELREGDVDFCYGSRDGLLWQVIDRVFDLDLSFETTEEAVKERKQFLRNKGIGICDTVESCRREKIDASDLGMQEVELRDLISILKRHEKIDTLLFTGGNSKNGPEFFFRRHLKEYGLSLKVVSNQVPRVHQFVLDGRAINTVSLTAPSGSANRAIGSMQLYKDLKKQNPEFNTIDFRVLQYRQFLEN
ncbi:G/U mismatch-specific uracil-DNA glycosylase [Salinimicrobium catena]|uniref:G/U mismatch-specific uracil-DNA glycosylase n=1 Tax=Salinimicrobium catena TaxID=390640 RepID=A0A1H5NNB7_9FLAO|nr:uracil-DNA glycosylase family protein [Salinimicrobium catena]SDL56406.1 G/U mismatch-specific uracil-DNA glycosylase [Salinimicrobium catena]SEF03066.1 G/U mismatch-specific uracil-DNA glycosylase [Salinimicrobium catena]